MADYCRECDTELKKGQYYLCDKCEREESRKAELLSLARKNDREIKLKHLVLRRTK